jgi:predicted metalloprotease
MDFRDRARLDTSQVRDTRGRGRGMAIGGGGLGLLGLVVALLLGVDPSDLTGGGSPGAAPGGVVNSELRERCQTGADADRDEDCRVVGIVNSVQEYWSGTLEGYSPATTEIFAGSTTTGCGSATSAVGPFYCPADQGIYLDLGFFDVLRTQYGARGGDFAQAYVIAHEYGHHVQNLTGTSDRVRRGESGPQSDSVRLELQADCYAGVWTAYAVESDFLVIDDADIQEGLSAAAAVGDDRIQETARGRVDPESWTHGSAEQRQTWFRTGLRSGEPRDCDTFAVPRV